MYKSSAALAALVFSLTGCSSKSTANESNFGAAISQYLDKHGDLCLMSRTWPVDVNVSDLKFFDSPTGLFGSVAALEKVGLAKSEEVDLPRTDFFGKQAGQTYKVKRYTLTEAGKRFERIQDNRSTLCWGKRALEKIVKWEGPMQFGDYQSANVTYLYKIEGLADWATKPDFVAAHPQERNILEGAGKKHMVHGVKLTSIGWEANGLGD